MDKGTLKSRRLAETPSGSGIRMLLSASEKAYRAYKRAYKPEADCSRPMQAALDCLKGELGSYEIIYDYLCGADTAKIEGKTTGYVLRSGDTVILDMAVGKDGLWCDTCRTFFAGSADNEKRAVYDILVRALAAGEKKLAAGTSGDEIFLAVRGVLKIGGHELLHHAGHAFGIKPAQEPDFTEGCAEKLARGMYVTLEPGIYTGNYGIRVENNYYIGNATENLFPFPLDIENYIL